MITKAGVPGEKVVVGVTSYGRSSKMATPGCWGPNCQFTGSRLSFNAIKGVPAPATSWANFIELAGTGGGPKTDHSRNGQWTDFNCSHKTITDRMNYTPSERWKAVDTDTAWKDIFTRLVASTLQMGENTNCGRRVQESCDAKECIAAFDKELSGPAGHFIWNSLVAINKLFADYDNALWKAASGLALQIDHLTDDFAPLPEKVDDVWQQLLTELLVLGGLGSAGPLFSKVLGQLAWINQGNRAGTAQDIVMTVLEQGTLIAGSLMPGGDDVYWTPEKQDEFSAYMGQVIHGWSIFNYFSLEKLLDEGSDGAIAAIWEIISDGKLIEGKYDKEAPATGDPSSDLIKDISKCVFGFTIPALWRAAAYGEDHYLEDLDAKTMKETGEWMDNYQWYLVYPKGESGDCPCQPNDGGPCNSVCVLAKFSATPGLDSLNVHHGSINTRANNEKENTYENLMNVDVTTTGYIHIPVCSPERVYQSWDTASAGSSTFCLCDIPPDQDHCGQSSFEDQISDTSPSIEDCRTIITNIQEDGSTDFTHIIAGTPHREILDHRSCHFVIEAASASGNADFDVGGQDVIDITNDAIKRFGRHGKIGAKGYMNCNGNIKAQGVEWGIY
ncbi:putative necrosis-inducing factor-domain-containing protein [Aspergillus venezuelensis]